MADPVLRLDNPQVSVEPGGQAQVVVTITSASSIVEGFALDVVGADPVRWAEVIPPSVSVYPGAEATAVVVFSPPPGAAAQSGTFPFGVRARSTEDASASAVVEGDVTLGKVSGLQAKITPVTSAGRWRGRHTIQLSNWGNSPVQLQLVASDPDAALGFYLRPDIVDLPIGSNATVRMTVRTRKPFLRGTPTRLPFQVIGEPAGAPPGPQAPSPYGDPSRPVVDGALNQKPILSRTFVTLVAAVLIAALAGGAYAFTRDREAPNTSLAGLGPPSKPKDFTLVSAGPNSVKAAWTPIAQITGYDLLDIDPADKTSTRDVMSGLSASLNQKIIEGLQADTEYCYQLRAVREGKTGPTSDVECARTQQLPPSASPTPTPTPTPIATPTTAPPVSPEGSPPPVSPPIGPANPSSTGPQQTNSPGTAIPDPLAQGKWVIVARPAPDNGAAQGFVETCVKNLVDQQITNAQVVPPDKYPKLRLTATSPELTNTWLAVVGPYDTPAAALALIPQVRTICPETLPLPVQPDPQ